MQQKKRIVTAASIIRRRVLTEINKLRAIAAEETAADAAPEKPPLLARMREKLPKKGKKPSQKQALLALAAVRATFLQENIAGQTVTTAK